MNELYEYMHENEMYVYEYEDNIVLEKNKIYYSEILLITNTEIKIVIEEWLAHYIKLGADHIVVIDNSNNNIVEEECKKYSKVEYHNYRNKKLSQSAIYNEYVNGSKSKWVLPLDDDEYLSVGKYKVLNSFLKTYDNKEKLSLNNVYMFSKEKIMDNQPSIRNYEYYFPKFNEYFTDKQNLIKTACNTNYKHIYCDDYAEKKYVDINGFVFYSDYIGTVHNPITKVNGKYIPAYNSMTNSDDYGLYSRIKYYDIDYESDVYLYHYKHKSFYEWNNKITRNYFSDRHEVYYKNNYNLIIHSMIYCMNNLFKLLKTKSKEIEEVTEQKYVHEEDVHNLIDPNRIIPFVNEIYKPESVIDIGCGIGTFLNVYKKYCNEIHGVDSRHIEYYLLEKYIDISNFEEYNLENEYIPKKRYDLAISLEVIEHINAKYEDNFIKTLVNCSDIILFSGAIPYQDGQGHVNCRWPEYWRDKFEKYGYIMLDAIRNKIWNDKQIHWWYKQNIFLVVNKNALGKLNFTEDEIKQYSEIYSRIHPDYYTAYVKYLKG